MKTQHERLMENPEYRKLFAMEGLVADAAELVARLMAEAGVNKAELARRLGMSRARVTQLLGGETNMTVRTLAELAFALGAEVKLNARSVLAVTAKTARGMEDGGRLRHRELATRRR